MAPATRQRLRELIDALPDCDLEMAQAALERLLAEDEESRTAAYHQRLLELGVVRRIPRAEDIRRPRDFQPIRFDGEPLSETIIKERR